MFDGSRGTFFFDKGSRSNIQVKWFKKTISKIEKITAKFAFSSVVSIKDINKGDKFTLKNLWVKRPGTGDYPANKIKQILGKKSKEKF